MRASLPIVMAAVLQGLAAMLPVPAASARSSPRDPALVAKGEYLARAGDCVACHTMQSAAYVRAQLENFARGVRHNDISQQMRNVARQMTRDEMDAAARYFASQVTSPGSTAMP